MICFLEHFPGFFFPSLDSFAEEKSTVFKEISGMAILVPIVFLK
jgi:hypothetical protein